MAILRIFTDGSVNTKSKVGYGAYLAVTEAGLSLDSLRSDIRLKRFEQTSSTKLELQTLLWALNDIQASVKRVVVHTDSQNIIGLPGRRERFEKNNYYSKKNRRLNNYKLYQKFFKMTDQMDCEFIKMIGHKASNKKTELDHIFTLVDRASREALRKDSND